MLKETLISNFARWRHHRPKYPSENNRIEPISYLRLPFSKEDLNSLTTRSQQPGLRHKEEYSISEGWFYKRRTKQLVGFKHGAVDYFLPYGFPVRAPCEGYAMSSYYSYPLLDRRGNIKIHQGKQLNFGIGYFVQIYEPAQDRFVQLGHLSNIAESIPFSIPEQAGNRWEPKNHTLKKEDFVSGNNPSIVEVKTGDLIGFVGYSGLTWGSDYIKSVERPVVTNPKEMGTWSVPHIHMDEFQRNYQTGKKGWRRDPYDIYLEADCYPDHQNGLSIGENPLFLLDTNNLPHFADSD